MDSTRHTVLYVRTENGVPALLPWKEALAEIDLVMMDKAAKRSTRSVYAARNRATIEYRDGRKVSIRPATPDDIAVLTPAAEEVVTDVSRSGQKLRSIEVKGKRYLVGEVLAAIPYTEGAKSWRPYSAVDYWTERNGKTYGATRVATEAANRGTVGAAIWAVLREGSS